MKLNNIKTFLPYIGLGSLLSFLLGIILGKNLERLETERKIAEIKRQILILSNKSANIEDKYNKLLYACALYEFVLSKASQSSNEEVRNLVLEYTPIANLLRDGGTSFIQRLKIRLRKESVKKKIQLELMKESK